MSHAATHTNSPSQLTKETVDCLLCGSARRTPLYKKLKWAVRCLDCGFVYASPRITREAAARLYSEEYFESHSSQEMGYDNYVSDRALVEKTFARRLGQIEQRGGISGGRVLDIGCATGFFLTIAHKRGWRVDGVEISEYCTRYAKEHFDLTLFNGLLADYPGSPGSFDLVTMWDYIEHSFVPDKDLERSFGLLRAGGLIAVATPDVASFPARLFREKWMGFKEYEHLYYFSKENLSGLLRRTGFQTVYSGSVGKYISTDFFAKRAKMYSASAGGAIEALTRLAGVHSRSFYCNPLDIAYVLARKPLA